MSRFLLSCVRNLQRSIGSNHSMELPSYGPPSFFRVYLTYDSLVLMMAWKLGPALATGNTIVLKPSGE
jgi:hypothetical protein